MPEKQGVHSWTSALSQIQIFADAGPKRLVVRQGAVKGRVRHMTGIRSSCDAGRFPDGSVRQDGLPNGRYQPIAALAPNHFSRSRLRHR
jgi:hypothetical protein